MSWYYQPIDAQPSAGPQNVEPSALALTLTPVAPAVTQSVTAGVVSLTLTPVAPAVTQQVAPAALALTLTPVAPIAAQSNVTVGAIALTLTAEAPTISSAAAPQSMTPDAIALTLTAVAPYDIEGGAITFRNLGSSAAPDFIDGTDTTSYSTASWTPPNGDGGFILVAVQSRELGGAVPVVPTVSGNGVTWTNVASVAPASTPTSRVTVFTAPSVGTTTGTTTVDFGSETQTFCHVSFSYVHQVEGTVQAPTASNTTGTTATVTLSAAADSDNRMFAAIAHNQSTGTNVTPRTNWTELDELTTSQNRVLETQYRGDATETTASGSWTNNGAWGIIGVELDHREVGAASQDVDPDAIALTVTPVSPQINLQGSFGAISLTLTAVAPSVTQSVAPGSVALTLTAVAPAVTQRVTPSAISLTLTPVAPLVVQTNLSPGLIALTLTPVTPSITQGASFGAIALVLTAQALSITQKVTPGAVALTLTPVAPVVTQRVSPAALALTLTPEAPVFSQAGAAQNVVPAAISLTLTVVAPVPVQTNLSPSTLALTLTPVAPVVRLLGAPGAISLTVTPVAPVVSLVGLTQNVTPAPIALAVFLPVGIWDGSGWGDPWNAQGLRINQSAAPPAISLTLTPVAPHIADVPQTLSPAAIALTLAVPAPYDIVGGAIRFDNLGISAAPDFADGTDLSTYTTASWTPPNGGGGFIVAFVYNRNVTNTDPATPTMSGNGTDWFGVVSQGSASAAPQRITMFVAPSEGSTTGVTTIDFGGETQTACLVAFCYVHQTDDIVQALSAESIVVSQASISLAAASDPDNRMIAGIGHNNVNNVTPRTNWTELDELTNGTNRSLHTQYRGDAAETTASGTWTTDTAWVIIAAEFDHREALAPQSVTAPAVGLTVTPVAPSITQSVAPAALALILSPVTPSIAAVGPFITAPAFALTLTPAAPVVRLKVNPGAIGLTLTPVAPSFMQTVFVRPEPVALTLTPVAPTVINGLGELAEVTDTVRIGATWFDPADIAGTKQAGRVHDVTYAGGFYYVATEGADRAMTLAGVTHNCHSLIRINATTMDLDTSWFPTFDLPVTTSELHSIATDGTTIWVGGNFNSMTLNSVTYNRSKVIAINATTGIPTSWSPGTINSTVRGVAYDAGHIYVVGEFTSIGGSTRNRAASLSASTAALETWNPNFGTRTNDIALFTATGGAKRLVIAMNGNGAIAGAGTHTLGVIGAIGEGDAGSLVWSASEGTGGGHVCAVSNAKQRIFYGTKGSGGNVVWSYNATGTKQWSGNSINTNGDIQALEVYEGGSPEDMLYVGTHDTSFSSTPGGSAGANVGSGFARFDIDTGNFDGSFFPEFKDDASAVDPYDGHALKLWCIKGFESRFTVAIGGDFTRVDTISGEVSPAPRRIAFFEESGTASPAGQVSPQPIALSVLQPAGGWDDPWGNPWDAGLFVNQAVGNPSTTIDVPPVGVSLGRPSPVVTPESLAAIPSLGLSIGVPAPSTLTASTTSVPTIALTLTPEAPVVTYLRLAPAEVTLTLTPVAPLVFGPAQTVIGEILPLSVVVVSPNISGGFVPEPVPEPEGRNPIFRGTPIPRRRVAGTRPR